jgi:hypothetical protein
MRPGARAASGNSRTSPWRAAAASTDLPAFSRQPPSTKSSLGAGARAARRPYSPPAQPGGDGVGAAVGRWRRGRNRPWLDSPPVCRRRASSSRRPAPWRASHRREPRGRAPASSRPSSAAGSPTPSGGWGCEQGWSCPAGGRLGPTPLAASTPASAVSQPGGGGQAGRGGNRRAQSRFESIRASRGRGAALGVDVGHFPSSR